MDTEQKPSPNFNERRGVETPSLLVLHYTGMKTAEEALAQMCDPAAEVSAHYMVDEDGSVVQLVADEMRAWHAGVSHWAGETDINSHSIGVEIVNPGHEFGYRKFPEAQIEAVIVLCKKLMSRHGIQKTGVLGHSDIAPERKVDPGHLFPWKQLANEGIGLWPEVTAMDEGVAGDLVSYHDAMHELLTLIGYDPLADFDDVMTAFHRRFCPKKFSDWQDRPDIDEQSTARLLALVRAYNEDKI